MTKTAAAPIITRRSKRQQGLEVTPMEKKQTKRKKLLSDIVDNVLQDDEEVEGTNVPLPTEGTSVPQPTEELNEDEGQEQLHVDSGTHPDAEESNDGLGDDAQTQQSDTKKRKTRWPTKMNKVAKNHEEKVAVEFTRLGEHVGKGSVTLSSFLGPLVREHVPYTLTDWRYLNDETRYTLWEEIQVFFSNYIKNFFYLQRALYTLFCIAGEV